MKISNVSKINYKIHTDSIQKILSQINWKTKKYVYAEESVILNVTLFGMKAKEWRENSLDLEENIKQEINW